MIFMIFMASISTFFLPPRLRFVLRPIPGSFPSLARTIVGFAGSAFILLGNAAAAAVATPKFIQSNYAVPQTPQSMVQTQFSAAQTAGNLNAVIVGWND